MSACMAAISGTGFLVPVCADAARTGNRYCLQSENPNPPTRMPNAKNMRLRSAAFFVICWHLVLISIRKIDRQKACRETALDRAYHSPKCFGAEISAIYGLGFHRALLQPWRMYTGIPDLDHCLAHRTPLPLRRQRICQQCWPQQVSRDLATTS